MDGHQRLQCLTVPPGLRLLERLPPRFRSCLAAPGATIRRPSGTAEPRSEAIGSESFGFCSQIANFSSSSSTMNPLR